MPSPESKLSPLSPHYPCDGCGQSPEDRHKKGHLASIVTLNYGTGEWLCTHCFTLAGPEKWNPEGPLKDA